MSIVIPPALADLQRTATDTFETISAYEEQVAKPALEWSDEERARLAELWAATNAAADALRAAIDASGLEQGDGYEFQRALKAAARESLNG
jgi:hypothetical protein